MPTFLKELSNIRFPDARGPAGSERLGAHVGILFAVLDPALRVADDNRLRASIAQHFSRNVPGIGSGRLGMAVLRPNRHARARASLGEGRQQRRGRANHHVNAAIGSHATDELIELSDGLCEPVHLPIAREQ